MTVEKNSGGLVGDDAAAKDRFPVGMRVLAVDDDPICLKVLENLLRKCQYHVTTSNQSIMALKMLRENQNKFDLVISDVNMPDMDGFKLLELVGLELDLPVIMLSSHSDTELVMKGISHGACDYLLKPVRIEELKNIWQHVIRRKRFESKDQTKSSNQDNDIHGAREGGQGATSAGSADQNGKVNRKRKDQIEDEEDEGEEDENDDDPSTQKKPRVVWSVELHRKFVAAVNQLGLEKAVPKKILDLMNVEGITRENVASHLQKYRLYLKRISSVASQQANMVAALGGKDSPYMRIGSLEGFGDYHGFSGSGRLSNTTLSGYPAGGMLGRLNSSAGFGLRGIASSGLIQPGHSQMLSNPTSTLGKIQSPFLPGNQSANLFQGIPTSLELNLLPQNKCNAGFAVSSSYPEPRGTLGSSNISLTSAPNNPFMLQGNPQYTQSRGEFSNQSIEIGARGSNFLDHSKSNESWQGGVQLPKFPSNPLPLNEPFNFDPLPSNNLTNNMSLRIPQTQNSPIDLFSSSVVSTPLEDSRGDMHCQTGLIGNMVQKTNYAPNQRWEEQTQNYNHNVNHTFSTINSVVPSSLSGPLVQSMDQRTALSSRNIDASVIDQFNGSAPALVQHTDVGNSTTNTKMGSNEGHLLEQMQSHEGFIQNSYDSLEDLMSAMIKREHSDTMPMDGEFGFDSYSLGSCM